MLQPVVRKTWSIKGQTPVLKHWQRHDRLSVISAISISPERKRLNLFFSIYPQNITSKEVLEFLRCIRRTIPGRKIFIMDNWKVHKAKIIAQFFTKHNSTISIEWLPPYSPELNPVESVWSYSKFVKLANFSAKDTQELQDAVGSSLCEIRSKSKLLCSFFHKSGLAI
jgi:transposase